MTPTETFKKMSVAFLRKPMKKRTVFHWHKMFRDGRRVPGDLPRSGRPRTARVPAMIQACDTLIRGDRRLGVHKISKTLAISHGTVFTILHKELNLTKRAAKFVPHILTDAQRERRMEFALDFLDRFSGDLKRDLSWIVTCDEAWFHVHDPNTKMENMQWLEKGVDRPQVARRNKSAGKVMVIPFFDRRGLVHIEYFTDMTITKRVLCPLLTRVFHSIRVRRGRKVHKRLFKYLLHMDNAPPHTSDIVINTLRGLQWNQLPHPPYSPDLSPCDFFLFPYLKRKLRGTNFRTTDQLVLAIEHQIALITTHQWERCFDDWIRHCQKCLMMDGQYFEGCTIVF